LTPANVVMFIQFGKFVNGEHVFYMCLCWFFSMIISEPLNGHYHRN